MIVIINIDSKIELAIFVMSDQVNKMLFYPVIYHSTLTKIGVGFTLNYKLSEIRLN